MRAAVMRNRRLVVDTLPDPEPGPGEVLVRTLACGICGSDLHVLAHVEAIIEDARHSGSALGAWMDPARDVVMGHEFCAEIVDYGPGAQRRLAPGTRVCSMPILPRAGGLRPSLGIHKELSLHFALGYTPDEFAATLRQIAEGGIPVEPLVTGKVGVEGVAASFEALATPERHAKILVEPWRS